MSTALRIASVTQVLKDLLNNGLIDHDVTGATGGNVNVTAWAPDKIDTSLGNEASQLNLFMYNVSYNQGWRNVSQPVLNQKGERIGNPPLAIDLHYILSAYGSAELHTEILLGYGMQLFHETMVLDRESIRTALGANQVSNLPDSLKLLSSSELADQVEQIKITPEPLTIEDISKLWAAFGAKYRPSAAYKVTVVLIESRRSTKSALPVSNRMIYVKPFKLPVIEKLMSQSALNQPLIENQKILNAYHIVLQGKQFTNEIVKLSIDGVEIDSNIANLEFTDSSLHFILPNGLKAGIHELQIVHPILMGSPPVEHEGVLSTPQAFVLSPFIVGNPVPSNITVLDNGLSAATIALKIKPAIQPGQRLVILLNEITNTGDARSYNFQIAASLLPSPPLPTEDLSIAISGVKKAAYLVRIQIDGAESPLNTDASGKYISPSFTLL